MGKELADHHAVARQTFEEADEALGYKLSQVCFEGPEEKLKLTEITQPAILTASVAAWRVLREKGLIPDYVAGHSLGEYSAHVAAGTLSFSEAVQTVRNRGKYMQHAVPVGVGAMAAILGMAPDKVIEIAREAANGEVCQAANINSPEQIVISGHAIPLRAHAAGTGSPGRRPAGAHVPESIVSGDLQCRCAPNYFGRRGARCAGSAGDRRCALE
jgi:[acyl-carrier-protein] S-malonyltransferase